MHILITMGFLSIMQNLLIFKNNNMKKIIIVALSVFIFSSCYTYRHDTNVRFKQKGTDYIKLKHLGCPGHNGMVGY
jgi:hypothetical protein